MNLKTGNRIYPIWAKEKKYTEKKMSFMDMCNRNKNKINPKICIIMLSGGDEKEQWDWKDMQSYNEWTLTKFGKLNQPKVSKKLREPQIK